jgi:hypothetical protein
MAIAAKCAPAHTPLQWHLACGQPSVLPLQETLDKLQQQLAQHESALKILLDTRLIMQWKVLKHSALRLKVSVHARPLPCQVLHLLSTPPPAAAIAF